MTRTILRRARAAGFPAVFAAVVLAGCSGASGDPGTGAASPSPSRSAASASPSPTPTPSAVYKPASAEGPAENVPLPLMPEEAKVESKEGLEAFARYWYELVNYGYETGDVGPVQSVSSPDCLACQNYYEVVDRGYAENDWIAAGEIEVKDAATEYILTPQGRYQALVVIQQEDMDFYGPEGFQGGDDGDDAPAVQLFEATYANGQWSLVFLDTMRTQSP